MARLFGLAIFILFFKKRKDGFTRRDVIFNKTTVLKGTVKFKK